MNGLILSASFKDLYVVGSGLQEYWDPIHQPFDKFDDFGVLEKIYFYSDLFQAKLRLIEHLQPAPEFTSKFMAWQKQQLEWQQKHLGDC